MSDDVIGNLDPAEPQFSSEAGAKPDDEEEPEKQSREKSIAEKLESTLRGFLDFAFAYGKTLLLAASIRGILTYDATRYGKQSKLVRPLTFLSCSYLPCAVILQVASTSIWDVLITPEIAVAKLLERLQDISPTKILLNAIPVLISVYLSSFLLARLVAKETRHRENFLYGMCYAFGLQYASAALLLGMFLLGHSRISEQILPHAALILLDPLFEGYTVFPIMVAASLYPVVIGTCITARTHMPHPRIRASVIALTTIAVTFFAYWLGELPTRFHDVVQPEARLSASLYEGEFAVKKIDAKTYHLRAQIVLRNDTRKPVLIDRSSGILFKFRLSDNGPEFPLGYFHLTIPDSDGENSLIAVKPSDVQVVSGDIALDYRDWQTVEGALKQGTGLYQQISILEEQGTSPTEDWSQCSIKGDLPIL